MGIGVLDLLGSEMTLDNCSRSELQRFSYRNFFPPLLWVPAKENLDVILATRNWKHRLFDFK